MDTDLVLRTLEDALNNRKTNSKLILHSDLGSQYTSRAYEKALKLNNIQHSYSRKGCPYDNAGIESFHASLKKERVYQQEVYPDFETAKLDIFDSVFRFYNRKRIHGSIGYLTPVGFEELINDPVTIHFLSNNFMGFSSHCLIRMSSGLGLTLESNNEKFHE